VVQPDAKRTRTEEGEKGQDDQDRMSALLQRDDLCVAEIDDLVAELKKQDLETPEKLAALLKSLRIKTLNKEEKRKRVIELAEKLVKDAIIAIPPQQWQIHKKKASSNVETRTLKEGGGAVSPSAPAQQLTAEEVEAKEARHENDILHRLGFIFIAYRVDYWWWEAVEMLRKFLMTWFSFPNRLPLPSCPASPPAGLCVSILFLGSSQQRPVPCFTS
jgi:hypothetical protein